jgi:hypothetical protein
VYDLLVGLLSLEATIDIVPPEAGTYVLWLLYVVVFYRVLPDMFPERLRTFATDRVLIGLLSVTSVWYGVFVFNPFVTELLGMTNLGANQPDLLVHQFELLGGSLLITGLVFAFYFKIKYGDPYDLESDVAGLLYHIYGEKLIWERQKFARIGGALERFEQEFTYVLLSLIFTVLCYGLAGVTAIFTGFSPLPEVGFIFGTILTFIPIGSPRWVVPDVETKLQSAMRANLVSTKTFTAIPIYLVGLFTSLGTVVSGIVVVQQNPTGPTGVTTELAEVGFAVLSSQSFGRDMAWIGAGILISTAGILYMLYWVLVTLRLPTFVRSWDTESPMTPSLPRPPYYALIPTVLFCVGISIPSTVTALPYDIYTTYHRWMGLLWPLGIVLGGYWCWQTYNLEPQPAMSDQTAIPVGIVITTLPFGLYVDLSLFLILLGGVIPIFYLDDILRYETNQLPDTNLLSVVVFTTVGVLIIPYVKLASGEIPALFLIISLGCLLTACYNLYLHYIDL